MKQILGLIAFPFLFSALLIGGAIVTISLFLMELFGVIYKNEKRSS